MIPLDLEEMDEEDFWFTACYRIACDEFWNLVDMDARIFFYGKIIEEDLYLESASDENKTYCRCPSCGHIFELDGTEDSGGEATCPKCEETGTFVNFRDKSMPLDDACEQSIACMETYKDGFCLRLFKAYADYSQRPYDDFTKLEYYPDMRFFEYGREYYHDGKLMYFSNQIEDESESVWQEVDNIDDNWFWIMNADECSEDLSDSPYIIDLKGDDISKPLMYHLAKSLSYNAFRCLQKYDFQRLIDGLIYVADKFPDSSKISEVLGCDYNQLVAHTSKDIDVMDLLSARKLYMLNVLPTEQNISLMHQMGRLEKLERFSLTSHNARKVFKYLRNQENKAKSTTKKDEQYVGRDYVDYLSECEKLQYDLSDSRVLYPTDLKKAHINTSSLVKAKANEATAIGIKLAYEKFHQLCSYDNGKFCVIMPERCEEIIAEGEVQSHCVGNYIERVANGEDIILFVRRSLEKETPFYTMEIRPIMSKLDIVQCRGFENEDPSPEIREEVDRFLAEYEAWFNRRKTIQTDKTTFIYYKAVKKIDGKYISAWDNKTEYIPGEVIETVTDKNPDLVAVKGIHIASLEFAQKYGDYWDNVAILEMEVDARDIVVPNAKDQIRASRAKVLREVPFEEMGEWGKRHSEKRAA